MSAKIYDLEERTQKFTVDVSIAVRNIKRNIYNQNYIEQVIKSSSSVGANYIEANEAVSKKDFVFRIKICRKEAKETAYWLRTLIDTEGANEDFKKLCEEAIELKKIFSSIIEKSK